MSVRASGEAANGEFIRGCFYYKAGGEVNDSLDECCSGSEYKKMDEPWRDSTAAREAVLVLENYFETTLTRLATTARSSSSSTGLATCIW